MVCDVAIKANVHVSTCCYSRGNTNIGMSKLSTKSPSSPQIPHDLTSLSADLLSSFQGLVWSTFRTSHRSYLSAS